MHTFINEIKYHSAEIIICPWHSSQFFPVTLNYKVKQDRLNSKTRATYEASHLGVIQTESLGGGNALGKLGTSGRGLADLTGNIISSPGFAFHANCLREPGSSLLMALPIKLEAHLNTNIPLVLWICHLESSPLIAWQLQQCAFSLHGIRHRPLWRASHNRCFAVVSTHHWSPNELN